MNETPSPAGTLHTIDWVKTGRGLFYTLLGCAADYIAQWADLVSKDDSMGNLTVVLVASGLANLLRRFVFDNRK